jgi:hypothetical protein
MQWAASSPHAGLGYLVRQAVRTGWTLKSLTLRSALATLRPYRLEPGDETIERLFDRIVKEVERQKKEADVEDIEEFVSGQDTDWISQAGLDDLISEGISLVQTAGDEKWRIIRERILDPAGKEKVVLFAQPIETVTALARYLEHATGVRPAMIIGGQDDAERLKEVEAFRRSDGPQFLVSSRAGGEGINLQVARRLVHIDVPWNPMDMEQRVGRVHRFGSRETSIVDTVVVKNSREEHAYRVARAKLHLIAETMVDKERFESVFSRVMCLVPQDELLSVLINDYAVPLDPGDEASVARMVQEGFRTWKDFHYKYSQQQKTIMKQSPGLATWQDLVQFLEDLGSGKRQTGYSLQRFRRGTEGVTGVSDEAQVVQLSDGKSYVCGDYGDSLIYGPDGSITPKCGLNIKPVSEVLRRFAFPDEVSGAAHLRWPSDLPIPDTIGSPPFGMLIFVRQTVRLDKQGGWIEQSSALHCYRVDVDSDQLVEGATKGELLRGLFRAVIRKSAEPAESLVRQLRKREESLIDELRRPTEAELNAQIRHAVLPLLAAVVTD